MGRSILSLVSSRLTVLLAVLLVASVVAIGPARGQGESGQPSEKEQVELDDVAADSIPGPVFVDDDPDDTTFDPAGLPLPVDQVAVGRQRFGLDTSPEVVSRLANDLAAVLRGGDWGFPVSEQEAAELDARLDMQTTSEPVFELASQLSPEEFSGVWVDMASGQIVVAFADDSESHADQLVELQKVAKYPDRIRIEQARFTLAELDSAFARLRESRIEGRQFVAGVEVSSVAVHMMRNVLHVGVVGNTETAGRALAAYLEVDPEILEIDIFTGEVEASKPRGGHRISVSGSATSGGCSVAAHVWNGSHYYLVTAGHCAGSSVPEIEKHHKHGTTSGAWHNPKFRKSFGTWETNSGDADVQMMRHGWPNYHEQPSKNVANWFGKDYRLNGVIAAGSAGDRVGDTVCQAGHKTGGTNHCGQIVSVDWDCGSHTGMRQADFTITGGDSGATVYRQVSGKKRQIAGLVEGFCNSEPRYTFQQRAISALPGTVAWYTD